MSTTTKRDLIQLAKSIKGRRVIGSLEALEDVDEGLAREVAQEHNLLLHILVESEGYWVIMFKPEAQHHLSQYIKYEVGGGKAQSLTPREHYELGLAFGFPKYAAKQFQEEMEEELRPQPKTSKLPQSAPIDPELKKVTDDLTALGYSIGVAHLPGWISKGYGYMTLEGSGKLSKSELGEVVSVLEDNGLRLFWSGVPEAGDYYMIHFKIPKKRQQRR